MLGVDVEEKATGELQLSAGYSSLEKLVLSASVAQRNFMGKGQTANAGINWSRYSRSAQIGFTEPYLFDKAILLGLEGQRPNLVEEKVLVTEFLLEQPDMDEARVHVQALAHCLLLAGEQAALFTVTRPDGYVQGHIMKV